MFRTVRPAALVSRGLGFALALAAAGAAPGQYTTDQFVTGAAAQAWGKWQAAMQALTDRDSAQAETAFGELLALDPSPLRVALLAQYTVERTTNAGAVLLFEQDLDAHALGPAGSAVAGLLQTGREQLNEADDGWYFCQIGRFDVADANFRAVLKANPDPVALLEFAEEAPKRRAILVQLLDDPIVGESARAILKLLEHGERDVKADPTRIRENIARLGGPPRAFENAVQALRDSGEYAIPFLIDYLRNPQKKDLVQPILRCLPAIDRPALNPLVMALRMDDPATKRYVIEALGKIGYFQAVPYLLQLRENAQTPESLRPVLADALAAIRAHGTSFDPDISAAQAFDELAEDYYADQTSLAADPRLDTANVWYWRNDMLQNVPVPTPIFNEIMSLRCCEESLRLDSSSKSPLALWLAADMRREAQRPVGAEDPTRPENYPPASYFAQSAGAEYCLMVLARAVDTDDPAVALGAIAALRKTAGAASLVTDAEGRLPLAEALSFPDRMVRIRAALALGAALPTQKFLQYQDLMPVLSEALMLHRGARNALVVDPDESSVNEIAGALRAQGYEVLTDAGLYPGLEKVRQQLPGIDVIFIAADITDPDLTAGLAALRSEFRFASTPVVLITKPGSANLVRDLVRADHRLGAVPQNPGPTEVAKAVAVVSHAVGAEAITPEVGVELARQAAAVLRLLALTNNQVFDVADAETALLTALGTEDVELRVAIAEVLGFLGSSKAQEAIARIALDTKETDDMRVKMFTALAEAAKRRGNLLGPDFTQPIVAIAESDPNMTIREAASVTLGALNLPGEPASKIVRDQYQG
jgi:tetratricopeptide (TPR) repeat protein